MVMYFNQPTSLRELRLYQSLLYLYPISFGKIVSNPYLGNLNNNVMDGNKNEMCFCFLFSISQLIKPKN